MKKALTLYIEHVFAQKLALRKFAPFVLALALFKSVKEAGKANYPAADSITLRLRRPCHPLSTRILSKPLGTLIPREIRERKYWCA